MPNTVRKIQLKIGNDVKYPTPRKLSNFISTEAKGELHKGTNIDITIFYAPGYTNQILHCSLEDLFYANEAFVKEYLR